MSYLSSILSYLHIIVKAFEASTALTESSLRIVIVNCAAKLDLRKASWYSNVT